MSRQYPHNTPAEGANGKYRGAMDHDTGTDDTILPWWRSPLNVLLAAIIVVLASAGIGYAIGGSSSELAHNEVDTGFLQDMRIHHEQAVVMSLVYLEAAPDGRRLLRDIAREIVTAQSTEVGRMVQMLRLFGASETNETDVAMSWMGMPVPLDKMPGLATDAELQTLRRSTGAKADQVFAELMIAHHEGGIHMAEFAIEHADNAEVVAMARAMVKAQSSEVNELKKLMTK